MASNRYECLYKCVGCDCQLTRLSKSLPCLHGVCEKCFNDNLDEAKKNCKCPKCKEEFANLKDFVVSPILSKEIMRQEVASSEWSCDWCSEDGVPSVAKYWCTECRKLFCNHCIRCHNKLLKNHISKDLDAVERSNVIAIMITSDNNCAFHGQELELFCGGCGNCYCEKCYAAHPSKSASSTPDKCVNVAPLRVRDEVLKHKEQLPTLEREMAEFEERVKASSDSFGRFVSDLKSECDLKVAEIWSDYEVIVEKAKQSALHLCEQIEHQTKEKIERWRIILDENDQILREIETWRLNFEHLLSSLENRQDVEILCGMKLLDSRFPLFRHSLRPRETKCELSVTFPDYWRKSMEQQEEPFESQDIGSVSLVRGKVQEAEKLITENGLTLPESKYIRLIRSIHVNKNDEHIFICDRKNCSLIEMNKNGKILIEFPFSRVANGYFRPRDICFISSDIFAVCGSSVSGSGDKKNLFFFKRLKISPFFQLKKFVETEKKFVSLCETNETVFVCDSNFEIDSFSKNGDRIETFKIEGLYRRGLNGYDSRIRVDPSSGKFWWANLSHPELICFDSKGKQINSVKKEGKFINFCFDEFGQIFFCDLKGIFSFANKKLFEFEEQQNYLHSIFAFENKIFVCVKKNGKYVIEILLKH